MDDILAAQLVLHFKVILKDLPGTNLIFFSTCLGIPFYRINVREQQQ